LRVEVPEVSLGALTWLVIKPCRCNRTISDFRDWPALRGLLRGAEFRFDLMGRSDPNPC
jgi:hypothetical protein